MGADLGDVLGSGQVVCAWCGTTLRSSGGPLGAISHGICAPCAGDTGVFPVFDVHNLAQADYDRLPFGALELDREGVVRQYNAAEEGLSGLRRSEVVGRNFFADIAPCTQVRAFQGRYREMVAAGQTARETFAFVFRFASASRLVRIAMSYDSLTDRGLILVRVEA